MKYRRYFSIVLAFAGTLAIEAHALAEDYVGIFGGRQFNFSANNLKAQELTGMVWGVVPDIDALPDSMFHPSDGSDLKLNSTFSGGVKYGHFFDNHWGFEVSSQYSRPDFRRQNVTITFTDGFSENGANSFTEDQKPAQFHFLVGSAMLLYRFDPVKSVRPFIGVGPSMNVLFVRGSGDSGNWIDPPELATGTWRHGKDLDGHGYGVGVSATMGFDIPLTDNIFFTTAYQFSAVKLGINHFRSFRNASIDSTYDEIRFGLNWKY